MSEIVAVLVVPAEGDPGGLLAEGRCGWVPAVVWTDHQPDGWHYRAGNSRRGVALPLWWDGALVPEGWDRARRSLWVRGSGIEPAVFNDCTSFIASLLQVEAVSAGLVTSGLASRVVRLTRDGSRLVEVP